MTFRRTGEEEVYRGPVISLAVGSFEGPEGPFERDVVHHPGAVSVVPVVGDGSGSVLMVRQYRGPLDAWLLEIPAGKRDVPDEAPEVTAGRELEEEVGMRAGRLVKLAEFYNSPGFCDELSHVYLAMELTPAESSAHSEEERHMTVERVALAEVPAMIAEGRLVDAKSIIGLTLAMRFLGL